MKFDTGWQANSVLLQVISDLTYQYRQVKAELLNERCLVSVLFPMNPIDSTHHEFS
jgi:hypothetical protein